MKSSTRAIIGGGMPLLIAAIVFLITGSFGIEGSTENLNKKTLEYKAELKKDPDDKSLPHIKESLRHARYYKSLYVYLFAYAGLMIIHAMAIIGGSKYIPWGSAWATILGSAIAIGGIRNFYSVGSQGVNLSMVSLGSAMVFMILSYIAFNHVRRRRFGTGLGPRYETGMGTRTGMNYE